GSRIAGLHPLEGLALGAALNARGAVELIVATVGLGAGVLNAASYTIVVLIAMATSMVAPRALAAIARRWAGDEDEQERLARERQHGSNLLVRPGRLLLPTHGGPNALLAARILDLAFPEGAGVSVFSAGADVPAEDLARVLELFSKRPAEHVHSRSEDALAAVLERAAFGYSALVVGATDWRVEGRSMSSFVDGLLAASPIPVVMVRRGSGREEPDPREIRRVLVPVTATAPGRAAQEVAFAFAKGLGAPVLLAHVVTTPASAEEIAFSRRTWRRERGGRSESGPLAWARQVVGAGQASAGDRGGEGAAAIRIGDSAPRELLALAGEAGPELIVLPASLSQLSERPFLGYGVEYLLQNSESIVVVVSLPAGWPS